MKKRAKKEDGFEKLARIIKATEKKLVQHIQVASDATEEKLARLIKEESEDIRSEITKAVQTSEQRTQRKMDEGFASVNRRLDVSIQPQLDDHAYRIKVLEQKAR